LARTAQPEHRTKILMSDGVGIPGEEQHGAVLRLPAKQCGKTEGGVTTYRWNLEQFLEFA
jgi:hypothetical protein